MDNAQKAIMIGVGLFITIIIISAVLLIVNLGTGLVDESTAKLDSISSSLQGRLTEEFDGKIMTGSRVLSAIKEHYNSTSLCIGVYASDGKAIATAGAKHIQTVTGGTIGDDRVKGSMTEWGATISGSSVATKTPLSDFTSTTSNKAINQSKQYRCSLIESGNGTVIGIAFQVII